MKASNSCRACKFWANDYLINQGVADCNKIGSWEGSAEIRASAADDQDLNATLFTNQDFCCSLFQPSIYCPACRSSQTVLELSDTGQGQQLTCRSCDHIVNPFNLSHPYLQKNYENFR